MQNIAVQYCPARLLQPFVFSKILTNVPFISVDKACIYQYYYNLIYPVREVPQLWYLGLRISSRTAAVWSTIERDRVRDGEIFRGFSLWLNSFMWDARNLKCPRRQQPTFILFYSCPFRNLITNHKTPAITFIHSPRHQVQHHEVLNFAVAAPKNSSVCHLCFCWPSHSHSVPNIRHHHAWYLPKSSPPAFGGPFRPLFPPHHPRLFSDRWSGSRFVIH